MKTNAMKANELPLRTLSLKAFDFDKARRELVAEASDLGPLWMGRLFNDACDSGIEIASGLVAGKCQRFHLADTEADAEGEVLAWIFEPLDQLARVDRVVVIND